MLHIAPEVAFQAKLRKLKALEYLTADLHDPKAMVRMDITNIPFPDNSFDIVYCSHVMEHVVEDRKAFKEFYRVLAPNGWAIFLVPIKMDQRTDEDHPSVASPKEREKRFGQSDHVRMYGWDFRNRVEETGFQVITVKAKDPLGISDLENYAIKPEEINIHYQKVTNKKALCQ